MHGVCPRPVHSVPFHVCSPSPSWVDITGIDVVVFGAWTAAWAPVAAIYGANSSLITSQPLSAAVPGQWGGKGCPSGARYVLKSCGASVRLKKRSMSDAPP